MNNLLMNGRRAMMNKMRGGTFVFWPWLLIAIFALGIQNTITIKTAAAMEDSYLTEQVEYSEVVDVQLVEESTDRSELIKYCDGKVQIGEVLILERDQWTVNDMLGQIKANQEKDPLPHYMYIDYLRMIRTIGRNPDLKVDDFRKRFYGECMYFGF